MRHSLMEGLMAAAAAGAALLGAHALGLSAIASIALAVPCVGLVTAALSWRARQRHVARTQAFIQRLIDGIPDAFYIKDHDSHYLMVNKAYADERGSTPQAIMGKTSWEIAGSRQQAEEWVGEDRRVMAGDTVYVEQRVEHVVTGAERFRILSKRRVENEDGIGVIVGAHFDITRWKQAEQELQAALAREQNHRERVQAYVQRLFDVIPMPVYVKDAQSRYQIVNAAQEREWGKTQAELIGVNSVSLAPNETVAATIAREDVAVLSGEIIYKEEHKRHAATGEEQFRVVTKGRCLDPYGQYVIICTLFDTTRWRVAERELARIAHEDPLTGLANRRSFLIEMERAYSRADRYDEEISMLMFDLDYFKRINDEHGHQVGDEVLIELARRVRDSLRGEDVPCRWGGEEFLVLLPQMGVTDALVVAERMLERIARSAFPSSAGALQVSASCGIAQRQANESIMALIARADDALYRAKDSGRNTCVVA